MINLFDDLPSQADEEVFTESFLLIEFPLQSDPYFLPNQISMQDLMIALPGLLIGFFEFVLGVLWVFASFLQRRKFGFILLSTGALGSSAIIISEQFYRVTVMAHHAPGMTVTQIGMALGWGALLFLCVRTVCFLLQIVGAACVAFASRSEVAKPDIASPPI